MPKVAHIIRRRHARKHRKSTQNRRAGCWLALIVGVPALICLLPLIAALVLAVWLYAQAAITFPSTAALVDLDPENRVTRFFDRSGRSVIYTVQDPLGEKRRPVRLGEIPGFVGDLTRVAENEGRAINADHEPVQSLLQVWRYMLGVPVHKDSGIIGRLTQNVFMPNARSSGLDDTLLELTLAAESKRRFSSDELLEVHLNTNYYGNDAFGIDAAAWVYLAKSAAELNLAEAALLAAIPESPRLNPFEDEGRARHRAAELLLNALNLGLIDRSVYDQAATTIARTTIEKIVRLPEIAPGFNQYARGQAQSILDNLGYDGARLLARGGLRITSTLDLDLYSQSQCLADAHLHQLHSDGGAARTGRSEDLDCPAARGLLPFPPAASAPNEAAVVILDVESGEILSLSGSALPATRQPGVVLQPFVYMEGFLRRLYTPATMVYDIPQVYPGQADGLIYTPTNPDGQFHGPLNLRDAMSAALLPPAIQVASSSGMGQVVRTAHRLGFNSLDDSRSNLEYLERGGVVSVLDAAYAYSVLAAMGEMRGLPTEPIGAGFRGHDPVAVLRIADAEDNLLWQYAGSQGGSNAIPVIEPSLAYLVNDVLADEEARQRTLDRADEALKVAMPAAVIDGLSADRRAGWTIGYTPRLVTAVHVAREDGAAMDLEHYDRAASAPIWRALVNYVTARDELPPRDWPRPADIEEFLVCEISGQLPSATDHCPTRREIVPAGTSLRRDAFWQTVEINSLTGQLATVATPDSQRRVAVYFLPPDDIIDWWIADGRPLPPSTYGGGGHSVEAPAVQLLQPTDYAYVGGLVEVAGRISDEGARHYSLAYGAGVNPQQWIEMIGISVPGSAVDLRSDWDTAELHGVYTLKLTALMDDGRTVTATRQVTLDNTPPTVDLRISDGASAVTYPAQRVISLLAVASDNVAIERVEFYQEAELLGVDRDWPYGFEYEILGAGSLNFVALAFDQVGNSADSVLLAVVEEE